jgi:hypothetical protein
MTRKTTIGGPDDKRLHRRQLFHWIGGHIDSNRSLSAEQRTEMYVECLSTSLRSGLWLKTPRVPDFLGKKREFEISLPICCFTETSVTEIGQHTLEYGRLGLGFPKRFVLQHSGMPVHYASEFSNHAVFASWCKIKRFIESTEFAVGLDSSRIDEIRKEFIFMSHFLKRMNKLPEQKSIKKKTQGNIEKAVQSVSKSRSQPVPKKYYGETLPYLEEREWRIVAKERGTDVLPKKLIKNPLDCTPDYYLPYQAGKDLFTVVLPDERTYAAVIQDRSLRKVLFGPGGPPVTLLCLKDIGTF